MNKCGLPSTLSGSASENVIVNRKVYLDTFAPTEPLTDEEHATSDFVDVTNIGYLSRDDIGIMARIRHSRRLARIFWRFLTEWMIVHDPVGVEIKVAKCNCGDSHPYYPAEWLIPVQNNQVGPFGVRQRWSGHGPVPCRPAKGLRLEAKFPEGKPCGRPSIGSHWNNTIGLCTLLRRCNG